MRPTRKTLESASQALAQLDVLVIGMTEEEINKILMMDVVSKLNEDAWDILERAKTLKERGV